MRVETAQSCVVGAINRYLQTRGSVDLDPVGPVSAGDVETASTPVRAGEDTRGFEFSFPETLIGGSDNFNSVSAERSSVLRCIGMCEARAHALRCELDDR